jgi:hypothetical protein
MARFKKALIPMLQSGKPISGVFEDVLGEKGSDPSFVLTAGSMAATIRFQLHSKDQFLSGRKKVGRRRVPRCPEGPNRVQVFYTTYIPGAPISRLECS